MKSDKLIVLATLVLAALYWFATEQINEPLIGDPIGPKAIPRLLIIGLLIAAVLLWLETLASRKTRAPAMTADNPEPVRRPFFILVLLGGTLAYFFLFNWLGYAIATALYLYALMAIFNPRKTRANALTATGFSLGSYLAFTRLFGAQIPAGLLPF
ncbi:MAG: tripartite tricarboxylate transporter TctB family protein [Rhodoferax sp.]|nr:tripartite tricarboxylate transporter TctB family protein [Rhodoferax sp.]